MISIIAFLSSVVLASLNSAREKAQATEYRQSVQQFIIALELYKNTNDQYPGEEIAKAYPSGYKFQYFSDNTSSSYTVEPTNATFNLSTALAPYIKTLPKPYKSGISFEYRQAGPVGGPTTIYRCAGDTSIPPFVILTSSTLGFEDWRTMEYGMGGPPFTSSPNTKCYSSK